jgi:hypothetical protein
VKYRIVTNGEQFRVQGWGYAGYTERIDDIQTNYGWMNMNHHGTLSHPLGDVIEIATYESLQEARNAKALFERNNRLCNAEWVPVDGLEAPC